MAYRDVGATRRRVRRKKNNYTIGQQMRHYGRRPDRMGYGYGGRVLKYQRGAYYWMYRNRGNA